MKHFAEGLIFAGASVIAVATFIKRGYKAFRYQSEVKAEEKSPTVPLQCSTSQSLEAIQNYDPCRIKSTNSFRFLNDGEKLKDDIDLLLLESLESDKLYNSVHDFSSQIEGKIKEYLNENLSIQSKLEETKKGQEALKNELHESKVTSDLLKSEIQLLRQFHNSEIQKFREQYEALLLQMKAEKPKVKSAVAQTYSNIKLCEKKSQATSTISLFEEKPSSSLPKQVLTKPSSLIKAFTLTLFIITGLFFSFYYHHTSQGQAVESSPGEMRASPDLKEQIESILIALRFCQEHLNQPDRLCPHNSSCALSDECKILINYYQTLMQQMLGVKHELVGCHY